MVVCRDYDGRTALHLAAAEGHAHCVQFLVTGCGVSPLLRDRWGFTPLVEAARFHHTPLVELLLEHVRQKMGQVTCWDMMEVVTVQCNGALCRPSTSRAARWWPGSRRRREPGSSYFVVLRTLGTTLKFIGSKLQQSIISKCATTMKVINHRTLIHHPNQQ